jgi:hypothetical protein
MIGIGWNNLDKLEEPSARIQEEIIIIILSAGPYPMVEREAFTTTMEHACLLASSTEEAIRSRGMKKKKVQ